MKEDSTVNSISTTLAQVPAIVTGTTNGVSWSLNLSAIPDERRNDIVGGLVAQGVLIIAQRAGSGKDVGERVMAAKAALKKLQDGTYSFGGGGGGPRLTPEQDAWIEFLIADGHKGTNGKNLEATKIGKLAAFLVNKGKATTADAKVKAEAELDKWVSWMEANNQALKTLIAGKRALAGGTAVTDDYPG